jgi:CBS domain-containing protein
MEELPMKAREIMTTSPEVVTPQDPISRAAQIMRDRDVGLVPVVKDRESMTLMGVITDRDLAVRHIAQSHKDDCAVSNHMSTDNIQAVAESDDLDSVISAMERREVRRVPVTDKSGKLMGIIAQADIANCEEIPKAQVAEVVRRVSEPNQ